MTVDLRWVSDHEILVRAISFAVLAYELLFPFWVAFTRTRPWALAFGVVLHAGIALTMHGLVGLSLTTAAGLVLFRSPTRRPLTSRHRW